MSEEIISTPLDAHFAALMLRLNGAPNSELERAARAVSAWRGAGHTCVPLAAIGGAELRGCAVVGGPGEFKPLILDQAGRLYLQRYWSYEAELAAAIRQRLGTAECDAALLTRGLVRLFPGAKEEDGQRVAAATAVRKKFCVITGGPGTGKTYTVARVLALLADQFAALGRRPRIALTAPTGKAAARMQESIAQSVATMPVNEALCGMETGEARTIHRLLGSIPGSPSFRHDRTHPLAVDVVIVDEASMVDLALMAKLLAAVPAAARVILLGDKDQLASVEAGSVLGDICGANLEERTAPIAGHIVELKRAHRFGADSGIQQASSLVNEGNAEAAIALLRSGTRIDLSSAKTPSARALESTLRPRAIEGFRAFLESPDAACALARLGDFRILCATRRGPYGVENLNRLAEHALATEGLIAPDTTHYHGRPVLVRRNDYELHLFNGDVGLILRDPAADGELRACFLDATGAVRRILPTRLPAHETSFAMTVHQSQGSEFQRVLLVLPDRDTPLATVELLYTGLTRARAAVEVWADDQLLRTAMGRRTERASGLREALWGA